MTECEYCRGLISKLIDGELNIEEHSALSAHVAKCSQCMAVYSVFSDLSELVRADTVELPEGLHENIMAGVRRSAIRRNNTNDSKTKGRSAGGVSRQTKSLLAAAACFVVVLFAASGAVRELSRSSAVKAADSSVTELVPESSTVMTESAEADYAAAGAANAAVYARSTPVVVAPTATPAPDSYGGDAPSAANSGTDAVDNEDPYSGDGESLRVYQAPPEETAAPASQPAEVPTQPEEPVQAPSAAPVQAPPAEPAPVPVEEPSPASQEVVLETGTGSVARFGSAAMPPLELPPAELQSLDPKAQSYLRVDMTEKGKWSDLFTLLAGASAAELKTEDAVTLPTGDADKLYTLTLCVDCVQDKVSVTVYKYAEALYYSLPKELGPEGVFQAKCSLEQYETYLADFPVTEEVKTEPSEAKDVK